MDDLEWADNILEDILVSCRIEVTINIDIWIVIEGIPNLPTDVINKLCPQECNGRGTCNNGETCGYMCHEFMICLSLFLSVC